MLLQHGHNIAFTASNPATTQSYTPSYPPITELLNGSRRIRPVILPYHVITLRICAVIQMVGALYTQTGYIFDIFVGFLSSAFGLLSFITGAIGLALTYFMHLKRLNVTYMVFSVLTAFYGFFFGITMFILASHSVGVTAFVCAGISVTATAFSCTISDRRASSTIIERGDLNPVILSSVQPVSNIQVPPISRTVPAYSTRNNDKIGPPPAYEE